MSTTVSDKRPKKDFTSITQLGLKALALAKAHETALKVRLAADMLDELEADLESLGVDVPGAQHARHASIAATSTQYEVLASAYARIMQIRAAIRRAKAPTSVQKGYGIGTRISPKSVRDVVAAITQILERAKAAPTEAAGFGIVQKDLQDLAATRTAVQEADTTQENARAGAPESTKQRNQTANRILAAVARIEGAGRMEFAADPVVLAHFQALGGSTAKRKAKATKLGAEETGEAGADG